MSDLQIRAEAINDRHKISGSRFACGPVPSGKDVKVKIAWFWKDVTCPQCLAKRKP